MFEQLTVPNIHPLLCRPTFDASMFDERGNENFLNSSETYEVGPPGQTYTYSPPIGWRRYGLKVLGMYGDGDKWLEPFGDPQNWYRAYHGTGRALATDFASSNQSYDAQYAPIDAIASIYKNGFRTARVAAYGPGVYCYPDPKFVLHGHIRPVTIDTQQGKKKFGCMLQVAVNPKGVITGNKNIWVVPDPKDIRAYGILIKEFE